jgi:hypothetical protein
MGNQEQTETPTAYAAAYRGSQKSARDFDREIHINQMRQEKIMLERRLAEIEGHIAQMEGTDAN